jgi:hypothetical protein
VESKCLIVPIQQKNHCGNVYLDNKKQVDPDNLFLLLLSYLDVYVRFHPSMNPSMKESKNPSIKASRKVLINSANGLGIRKKSAIMINPMLIRLNLFHIMIAMISRMIANIEVIIFMLFLLMKLIVHFVKLYIILLKISCFYKGRFCLKCWTVR